MKSPYFRLIAWSAAILIVGCFLFHPLVSVVHAQTTNSGLNTGLNFVTQTGLSNQDIRITIAKIIRIILGFLGIIAIGLIMYAGFLWMTSKGNEEKTAQAKLILRNGVIGLAIILASFAIATFILNRLLGATGINNGQNNNGNNNGSGIGALGSGIVKSVYPEPFQKDVPRNTSIVVTFREPMLASSICENVTNDSPAKCAPGTKIKTTSVKIFKTTIGDHPESNLTDVAVSSVDNLTFVFKPAGPNYLGSPIENINYTVSLSRDIKKANGSNAFNLSDFYWSFEVSNLLDLTSPQIKDLNQGGIYPIPDNEADTISGTQVATKAVGSVTVNGTPNVYSAASATVQRLTPPSGQVGATVSGTNICADGNITISIISQGSGLAARVAYSQPGLVGGDLAIINNNVGLNPCGLTLSLDPGFVAGHSWRITVKAQKQADTLTIGSKIYSFVNANPQGDQIIIGSNSTDTATNIITAINKIHPEVVASGSANKITITAKIAGQSGNRLELSTSNASVLGVSAMRGGADQTTTYTVKDKKDQPKNTVIQINFNESVNPLMVSGKSDVVGDKLRVINAEAEAKSANVACTQDSDCLSYKCSNNLCVGNELAGTWQISNQYKTVEFISDIKCGVNGCGESIYCLPANSHLKIEATAASLQACTSSADCTSSPFTTCEAGVCKDTTTNKNYPTAPVLNGVVDLADNSLDGNRDNNAQGQVAIYDENKSPKDNAGRGDNYVWSFWTNDKLDLTPPQITGTSVNNKQSNVNLTEAIEIIFSKLMMSSSLSTGSVTINNGVKDITHKLINLWSLANNPIGYWTSKQDRDVDPADGEADRTSVFLNHGLFSDSTEYQAQVGSGVKDIYQNCYKPSVAPGCNANALQPSCCRNQAGDLVPTAELGPDGNCPVFP